MACRTAPTLGLLLLRGAGVLCRRESACVCVWVCKEAGVTADFTWLRCFWKSAEGKGRLLFYNRTTFLALSTSLQIRDLYEVSVVAAV